MIAFPAGTRVWIAGGVTDMRCGMNSLALKIQQGLGRDPHSGEIFCFRGRKADVVKLLWFDGIGVSLYAKRLEAGKFVWPSSATGAAVAISAAQLGYLSITHVDTPHCQADRFSNPVRRSRDFAGSALRPARLMCRETDRHRLAEG